MEHTEISDPAVDGIGVAELPDGQSNDHVSQFVAFSVGTQNYCVDIMQVREIRAWTGATALPNSAEFVRGVINLRGHIVPVIDLKARFGLGETDTEAGSVVVIVMIDEKLHGLLVDGVSDILNVEPGDIAPSPDIEADGRASFLNGIVTDNEEMVAIIDLNRLVAAN